MSCYRVGGSGGDQSREHRGAKVKLNAICDVEVLDENVVFESIVGTQLRRSQYCCSGYIKMDKKRGKKEEDE